MAIETVDWHDDRCKAVVYKRDTYRYDGRGKTGFSMHYNKCQCSRKPVVGDFCMQHAKQNHLWTTGKPMPVPAPTQQEPQ